MSDVLLIPLDLKPQAVDWSLQLLDGHHTGELNGITQDVERPAIWTVTLTWSNMTDADSRAFEGFMRKAARAGNRVAFVDMSYTPLGSPGGSPQVDGASQTGRSLVTKGWDPLTLIFKAGDLVGLETGQLLQLTDDVMSDSAGAATLSIEPALRDSPADGSLVEYTYPAVGNMRIGGAPTTPRRPPRLASNSIQLVEDPQTPAEFPLVNIVLGGNAPARATFTRASTGSYWA